MFQGCVPRLCSKEVLTCQYIIFIFTHSMFGHLFRNPTIIQISLQKYKVEERFLTIYCNWEGIGKGLGRGREGGGRGRDGLLSSHQFLAQIVDVMFLMICDNSQICDVICRTLWTTQITKIFFRYFALNMFAFLYYLFCIYTNETLISFYTGESLF